MRRQHTFTIVSQSTMDAVLQDKVAKLRQYNSTYQGDDKKDPENWQHTGNDDDLRAYLNFLEGISAAVRSGDLDENLLHSTYRGIVVGYFKRFEKHIYAHREDRKTERAFENLQWLAEKWHKKTK